MLLDGLPSVSKTAKAAATASAFGRCTLEKLFCHIGCSCGSHCVLRTGKQCSKASQFPGGGHFKFFPSFSTN